MPLPLVATALKGVEGEDAAPDAEASTVAERTNAIIAAADDPIIPAQDLDRIARPAALTVTRTSFGGHCGFYDARPGGTWIEREVYATLAGA